MMSRNRRHGKPSLMLVNNDEILQAISDAENERDLQVDAASQVSSNASEDLFADLEQEDLNQSRYVELDNVNVSLNKNSIQECPSDPDWQEPNEASDKFIDSDSASASDDPTNVAINAVQPGKQPKTEIWRKFVTKKDRNNKITSNKCVKCQKEVSAKADRMRSHVASCYKEKSYEDSKRKDNKSTVAPELSFKEMSASSESSDSAINRFTKQLSAKSFCSSISPQMKANIDMQLGRFLFSTDLSFNTVQSVQFNKFVKLLNPAYNPPCRITIGNSILDAISEEVNSEMAGKLFGKKVCILQDGWSTTQNAPVISHCLTTEDTSYFLSAEDTGASSKTAHFCLELLATAMSKAEVHFGCEVVGVVTDNCSTMASLHRLCKEKFPQLYVYGCNSHLLNLIGSHFTPSETQLKVSAVQKYMRNHHYAAARLKESGARRPVLPGTTRWNSQVDSFISYIENDTRYLEIARESLQKMKNCDKEEKSKIIAIISTLQDSTFYSSVQDLIGVLRPVCISLDKLQGQKSNIADAVSCWLDLRVALPLNILSDEYYLKQEKLGMTDIAIAAYILHPKYKGKNLSTELRNRGMNFIATKNPLNVIFIADMVNETSKYFFTAFLKPEVCQKMPPMAWWKSAATSEVCEDLKEMALSLFALPSSTGSIERSFSTLGNIMTKQRNRLSVEKASKLCSAHNYFKLQEEDENQKRTMRKQRKRDFLGTYSDESPASSSSTPDSLHFSFF